MEDPITDAESAADEPRKIYPMKESGVEVTIVHHNGSVVVEDFVEIAEIDTEMSTLRVFYEDDHTDYHGATITSVQTQP